MAAWAAAADVLHVLTTIEAASVDNFPLLTF